MKTKYILIVAFLYNFYIPTQAQNDGAFWQGIQNTLINTYANNAEVPEGLRLLMLYNSDIRIEMKVDGEGVEGDPITVGNFGYFWYQTDIRDGSIEVKFDWDNKALSMRVKQESYSRQTVMLPVFISDTVKDNSVDHFQFIDKDGFWYSPFERLTVAVHNIQDNWNYVKVHKSKILMPLGSNMLESISESLANNEASDLINFLVGSAGALSGEYASAYLNMLFSGSWSSEIVGSILRGGANITEEFRQQLLAAIRGLLNNQYLQNYPIFVHWAFMYSPNFVRQQLNVNETRVTHRRIPNCLKLTATSGRDRGKSMIFDQYNRLIYIDSKKEGTAEFYYDRDLTVNIPAAYSFADATLNLMLFFRQN